MFTKQCHAFLSYQTSTLLLPKGAPTTMGSVHARSKRLHAKHTFINHSQRCSLQLPEPSNITPINSIPKKPTLQHLHASTNESANAVDLHVNGPEHLKPSNSILKGLDIFIKFTRPYAIIASAYGTISSSLLPVTSVADLTSLAFFKGFAEALTIGVLMNLYINALNQMCDVEIDKINKPHLPLISGEMSMTTGKIITTSSLIMCFILAIMSGSLPLVAFVAMGFFLGCAYSVNLPLLRWKGNPILAAAFMVSFGGFVMQMPFFLHMQVYVLKRQMVLTKPLIFSLAMISFLMVIVSLVKDMSDVEGDKADGVQTFAILFGVEGVFKFVVPSLMVAYAICIGVGASSTNIVCRTVSVLGHATLASVFWFASQSVDLKNNESIQNYYMQIFKLVYAEYLLVHFIR